jgi:hypothetical protein
VKYPLDPSTFSETINTLVEHNKMQEVLVQKVCSLLQLAMDDAEYADSEWYVESETLFKDMHALKMYHESRRFNEDNFRKQYGFEPAQRVKGSIDRLNDLSDLPMVDDQEEAPEMSHTELDVALNSKRSMKKRRYVGNPQRGLQQMSEDEISSTPVNKLKELVAQAELDEQASDNSTDIYKIKARVANLARGPGMSLTPQGVQLCNTFVHVLKSFYDFADKIQDPNVRVPLIKLIRSHEKMPGVLIASAGAGVVQSEKDKDKI